MITTILTIILYRRYYDTKKISSISITVTLQYHDIYDNIVILPNSNCWASIFWAREGFTQACMIEPVFWHMRFRCTKMKCQKTGLYGLKN